MLNELSFLNSVWKACLQIPGFYFWSFFLINVYFLSQFSPYGKHSYLEHFKLKEAQQQKSQRRKLTIWCVVRANGVPDQYHIKIETVRSVDFYQVLDTYVQLEGQPRPQGFPFRTISPTSHSMR